MLVIWNCRLKFSFTLSCNWSRKLAPLSRPIRCKTKTKHNLVTRVFPRFRQFGCFYFEFSWLPYVFFLALISPFDYCGVILRRLIEKCAKLELTKNKTDAERNEGYQFRVTRLLYVCPNHSAFRWNASL